MVQIEFEGGVYGVHVTVAFAGEPSHTNEQQLEELRRTRARLRRALDVSIWQKSMALCSAPLGLPLNSRGLRPSVNDQTIDPMQS